MKILIVLLLLFGSAPSRAADDAAHYRGASAESLALLDALHFRAQFAAGLALSLPCKVRTEAGRAIGREPGIGEDKRKAIAARLAQKQVPIADDIKAMTDDADLMVCIMVEVGKAFARHFSDAEMRAISAFYRSPAGPNVTEKMMAASSETTATTQMLLEPRITALAHQLEHELRGNW